MNNIIRLVFLLCLVAHQAKGEDLNFFSDGINYWGNGKKN